MSQPIRALAPLPFDLVYDDGEPLETHWHAQQIPLITHLIRRAMLEQGRTDFFTGGNLFVYYSVEQAREVALEEEQGLKKRAFRGPDVFWVGGIDPQRERQILDLLGGGRPPARPDPRAALPFHRQIRSYGQEGSLRPGLRHVGVLPLRPGSPQARRIPSGHAWGLPAAGARCPGAAPEREARSATGTLGWCLGGTGGDMGQAVPSGRKPGPDRGRSRKPEG